MTDAEREAALRRLAFVRIITALLSILIITSMLIAVVALRWSLTIALPAVALVVIARVAVRVVIQLRLRRLSPPAPAWWWHRRSASVIRATTRPRGADGPYMSEHDARHAADIAAARARAWAAEDAD